VKRLILIVLTGVLAGCGSNAKVKSGDDANTAASLTGDFARSKVIAQDFTNTMVQIDEIDPRTTALYTVRPESRFAQLLLGQLQTAGFDLRVGESASGTDLRYSIDRERKRSKVGNPVFTFIVSAGQVKLKRSYEVDSFGVQPASTMFVLGTDPDAIAINDTLFERSPVLSKPTSTPDAPATPAVVPEAVPLPTPAARSPLLVNSDANAGFSQSSLNGSDGAPANKQPQYASSGLFKSLSSNNDGFESEASFTPAAPVQSEALAPAPRVAQAPAQMVQKPLAIAKTPSAAAASPDSHNMYETGQSVYQSRLLGYGEVRKEILVFGNDSMLLGRENKSTVLDILQTYNPDTDLISLIGCSHGKTSIEDGNKKLAQGRARRVKEEFLLAGLDGNQVLDEGCWANVHFDEKMPRRGVVVIHQRRG